MEQYGTLKCSLVANNIPYIEVLPRQWKRDMGLSSDKEQSRFMAMELFPEMKPQLKRKKDHGRSEALILLKWEELYGDRKQQYRQVC